MPILQRLTPCLWFADQAEEAANFYVSVFDNSRVNAVTRYGEGGDPAAQQCGWLKDRFGLSWQVVPRGMERMLADPASDAYGRAFTAMLEMKKIDIVALEAAHGG